MKTFSVGGIHPKDHKISASCKITDLPLPERAVIRVNQHIGAPATPIVSKGDRVKVGQLIAKAAGFVSANIHSPFSGVVEKIDTATDAWGLPTQGIYIKVEGDEWEPSIIRDNTVDRICTLTPEEIVKKVADAGIVGLGGACFPTHVKLSIPQGAKAEVLVVNGVECEPYLTCDHRLMIEHAEEIFVGITIIMKAIGVERAIIGIESNKRDAIELMERIAARHFGVEVCPLKMHYPQGGEKQLVDATTGRQVPSGGLPLAVGAVVQNVATCFAVYEAVQKNKPLFERIVTVTGPEVTNPGNFRARFGTPLENFVAAAGGLPTNTGKVISGGPMMGRAIADITSTSSKRISGLLVLPQNMAIRKPEENCIRCGACVNACPMALEPYLLINLSRNKMWDRLEREHVTDCIECGCCLYSCPAHQPLLDYIRFGKATVTKMARARSSQKK